MANKRRGCGCGFLVVALLILGAVAFYYWRERAPKPPPPAGGELRVQVLDVGQGDAILVRTPSGKIVLVDAGVTGSGRVSAKRDAAS
ncbi:MAG: hypothetical protein WKF84_12050 [Pyrinomonadaceae bacterium]